MSASHAEDRPHRRQALALGIGPLVEGQSMRGFPLLLSVVLLCGELGRDVRGEMLCLAINSRVAKGFLSPSAVPEGEKQSLPGAGSSGNMGDKPFLVALNSSAHTRVPQGPDLCPGGADAFGSSYFGLVLIEGKGVLMKDFSFQAPWPQHTSPVLLNTVDFHWLFILKGVILETQLPLASHYEIALYCGMLTLESLPHTRNIHFKKSHWYSPGRWLLSN